MLNTAIVMGRLVRDPELRSTQNSTPVTSFTIAVDRSTSKEKETDFFDVVAWRSTAEYVCKYFAKGRMAIVKGRLQQRRWEDKEGNKRSNIEIIADSVYFGDSKPGATPTDAENPPSSTSAEISNHPSSFAPYEGDGELPF